MIEIKNKYNGDVVQTFIGSDKTLTRIKFDKNKDFSYVNFENLELDRCDFSEVDLTGVEFKHCFINECVFSKSNLKNSEFNFCELSFCKFDYSILDESYFCHCEIRSSDFTGARLEDNIIEMSYLADINFEETQMNSFEICHTMLHDIIFLEKNGNIEIDFNRCSMQNINFDTSGYNKCNFSNCIFDYIFIDGNLVGNSIGTTTTSAPQSKTSYTNNSCNICKHYSLFTTLCNISNVYKLSTSCCGDFEEN